MKSGICTYKSTRNMPVPSRSSLQYRSSQPLWERFSSHCWAPGYWKKKTSLIISPQVCTAASCNLLQPAPALACHIRGMVRLLGLSDPQAVGWYEEYQRVDCRSAQVKSQPISRCTGNIMNFVSSSTIYSRI